jgi:hypothetical protein
MESPRATATATAARRAAPGKLKMVECKAILGCSDKEWSEIGAIVLSPTI